MSAPSCVEPDCTGTYEDGWCNICGSPEPTHAPVPTPDGDVEAAPSTGSGHSAGSEKSAAPLATPGPGQTDQAVRAARERRQRASAAARRSALGMGLTHVPAVPPSNPDDAVLTDPRVPENRRICPHCGAHVGRAPAATDAEGRQQGYCPQCRAPYSFTPKLLAGERVAGQYEVSGAIAHGGMGWIYLARDQNVSGRWVVLKGLLNTGDAEALDAAVAEQQFLAQVKHPLIVEIYNVVTHDGDAYTVMEYVGGTSLTDMLKRQRATAGRYQPFSVAHALAYVIEVLPALSHLHDLGLLFCDFKPDNLIQEGDGVKLIDLGGVRRQDDLESPIYGTVGYQAPEVAEVGPSIASDIYTIGRSLCVLTFEFRGYQRDYVDTLPPTSAVSVFTEQDAFYRLIARCCQVDPNDRFLTIDELRNQAIGVLRQAVATGSDHAATASTHSALFEVPTATSEALSWWELPAIRADDTDPMLDWLSGLSTGADPAEHYRELKAAGRQTPEVLLARARVAIQLGSREWLEESLNQLAADDPWDWRVSWLRGVWELSRANSGQHGQNQVKDQEQEQAAEGQLRAAGTAAAGQFALVRDMVPGELAPRLALALASELAGYQKAAELDYQRVWQTDAGYVAPAAFGLHRVRLARDDVDGALQALDSVPASSRAHPRARWLRAELLRARGGLSDLPEALHAISRLTLDPRQRAQFLVQIYEQALEHVRKNGEDTAWQLGNVPLNTPRLRTAIEQQYHILADYTPDPGQRAVLIDRANAIRPWSWT